MGKGHHLYKLKGLAPQMLRTKFQGNRISGSGDNL